VKIELSSISGTGFGGLPTFGNRSINTVIRLQDGETNMLAGLIRDEERRSLAGIPGLSDLPVVGRLFAYTRKEVQETDIILTLTPRIVRVLDLTAADLAPFRMSRDGVGGSSDLPPPMPSATPPRATPPPGTSPSPAPPGGIGAPPASPVRPPGGPGAAVAPPAPDQR